MKNISVRFAAIAAAAVIVGCSKSPQPVDSPAAAQGGQAAPASAALIDIGEIVRTWTVSNTDFFCPANAMGECHMGRNEDPANPHPGPNPIDYLIRVTPAASAGEFLVTILEVEPLVSPAKYPTSRTIGYGPVRQDDPMKAIVAGDVLFWHGAGEETHYVTLALRNGDTPNKPLELWINMSRSKDDPAPIHDGAGHAED